MTFVFQYIMMMETYEKSPYLERPSLSWERALCLQYIMIMETHGSNFHISGPLGGESALQQIPHTEGQ